MDLVELKESFIPSYFEEEVGKSSLVISMGFVNH